MPRRTRLDTWENGNYVAAGQWRALALPKALQGKIAPDEVYSIDPSQAAPSGYFEWSYVRPSITAQPYAIANNLPYNLVANFQLNDLTTVTEKHNRLLLQRFAVFKSQDTSGLGASSPPASGE